MNRSWSLKNILTSAVIALAVITLVVASALIVLTTQLHRATEMLGATLQSIRVTDEAAINLLLHSQATDPVVLARTRTAVRNYLREAERFVSTAAEGEVLRVTETAVERYFTTSETSDMRRAYAALDALSEINLTQALSAQQEAGSRSELGNLIGFGAATALAALVLVLVVWLRGRAFAPVFALGDALARFSRGRLDARAPEKGPAELRRMAEQFNSMATSLSHQRETRIAFMAGVAHELRNPLAALKLSVSLLAADRPLPGEEQIRSTAARLQRQMAGLDRLVGDLLNMARLEAGQLELDCAESDLLELARSVVELFRPLSTAHELELRAPPEPVTVWCDHMRIEQVLNNLVTNAIKYSPGGGKIVIELSNDDGEARLTVKDRGVGIDPEDVAAIFDPFNRAPRSARAISGVGLGLYVARLIVDAHGGRIEVSSRPGEGSEFTLSLRSIPQSSSVTRVAAAS